jgi:hypothetical protein
VSLRSEIEELARAFDLRARSPYLRRVSKQRLLEKCAADLRALLADPRYAPVPPATHAYEVEPDQHGCKGPSWVKP